MEGGSEDEQIGQGDYGCAERSRLSGSRVRRERILAVPYEPQYGTLDSGLAGPHRADNECAPGVEIDIQAGRRFFLLPAENALRVEPDGKKMFRTRL